MIIVAFSLAYKFYFFGVGVASEYEQCLVITTRLVSFSVEDAVWGTRRLHASTNCRMAKCVYSVGKGL